MKSQPTPKLRAAVAGLPAYVAGRKADSALVEPLAANESHYLPLPSVLSALAAGAVKVNRYPDMASIALRSRLAEEFGLDVDEIAVGPGSVGVLSQLISAVCDPGDEVVFAWRSFEAYPILCQIAGAVAVKVPLTADDRHDLDAIAAAVTKKTKIALLCSPNNPTGTSISISELTSFLDKISPRVLVVVDEAYREFAPDLGGNTVALFRKYPNLCLLRTFSKAYGLAALRVGYTIARPDIAEGVRRTQVPFSVSALAEGAAVAAIDAGTEMTNRAEQVVAERDRVIAAARDLGWPVPDSTANFFWLRLDDDRREQLMAAFDEADILVRGYASDGIRITIGTQQANDRVLAVLAAHSELSN
jgi:histidinol-phosphate aminotransferase